MTWIRDNDHISKISYLLSDYSWIHSTDYLSELIWYEKQKVLQITYWLIERSYTIFSCGEANKKTIRWFVQRLEKFTKGDVTKDIFHKAVNQNVSEYHT